jgi:flagellar basal body-associated protein FliL
MMIQRGYITDNHRKGAYMEIKGGKVRIIVLAVAVVIVCIASAAYFNIGRSNAGEGSGRVAVENASEQATVPTQAADSKSNILVVYFTAAENSDVDAVNSASVTVVDGVAKGNVRAIADEIAAQTGGDLFSIPEA